MSKTLRSMLAAVCASVALVGCSANTVMTHSSAIDHTTVQSTTHASQDVSRDRAASYRIPGYHHTSVKGDASKVFVAAGQEHFKNQNYGLAQENFQKAVETSSDNAVAWLGLAASLDQLGQFDTADKAYEQLVELKSNSARVYNNIGYSYLLRGEYSKARQYLNRAQSLDPELEEVQGNIHLLEKTFNS